MEARRRCLPWPPSRGPTPSPAGFLMFAVLLLPLPVRSQQAVCGASVASLRLTHPNLHCTCPSEDSIPDCTDSQAPARSTGGGRSSRKGGLSFENQVGLFLMQGIMDAMVQSLLAPTPAPAAAPPPPPPEPTFVPNPAYEEALKKFSEFQRPDSELRRALVAQLAAVPPGNLPPKNIELPKQLLLSACIGKQAALSSQRPAAYEETELLLRQSAQALQGEYYAVSMQGCAAPEPPMPSPASVDMRVKAAGLIADLFARAGELSVRSAQAQERARRAESVLAQAQKTLAEPSEDENLLQAAREQEAAARRELEAAREEAERLKKEAEEAAKKGRGTADKLDQAGNDEGKLNDLFKEFGDGA